MGRASCVCYNTKYGARCASSACWNRRRGIRGVGTAAHQTSFIWPTLVEQDSTWEVEGNMDGPRSYPPQLRINRHLQWIRGLSKPPTRTRMLSWGLCTRSCPRASSQMTILSLSDHGRDTVEWSLGLDINLWGPYACWPAVTNTGHHSCGPTSLTTQISISWITRKRRSTNRRGIRKQVFRNKVFTIFQRLAKTEQVCHVFLRRKRAWESIENKQGGRAWGQSPLCPDRLSSMSCKEYRT